jgi:hypothetical protein
MTADELIETIRATHTDLSNTPVVIIKRNKKSTNNYSVRNIKYNEYFKEFEIEIETNAYVKINNAHYLKELKKHTQ